MQLSTLYFCYYFLIPPLKKAVSDSRPWFWWNWWYAWQCNNQPCGMLYKRLFIWGHVQVLATFHPFQSGLMKKIHTLKCFSGCFSFLVFIIWSDQTVSRNSLALGSPPQVQKTKYNKKSSTFYIYSISVFSKCLSWITTEVSNYNDWFL